MRRVRFLVVAVTVFAGAACGPGVPSEASGRQALVERIDSGIGSRLRVGKFVKTDGQMVDFNGVHSYRMEYTAQVAIVQSAFVTVGEGLSSPGILSRALVPDDTSGAFSWAKFAGQFVAQGMPALAGDALAVRGIVAYQKKESGWRVSGVEFSVSVDTAARAEKRRTDRERLIAALTPLAGPAVDTFTLGAGDRAGRWAYLSTGEVYFGTTALGFRSILENFQENHGNTWLVRVSLSRHGPVALVTEWDPDRGGGEILIVDTKLGKVLGRLTAADVSFPFEWSPSGRWAFGYSAYEGTSSLVLADIQTGMFGVVAIEAVVEMRSDPCGRVDISDYKWIADDTVRVRGQHYPDGLGCVEAGLIDSNKPKAVDLRLSPQKFSAWK